MVDRELIVERQKIIPIRFEGLVLGEAFRADIVIEGNLLIEVKSTDGFAAVHGKQVLTYLRLMGLPLGLLMNFGAGSFRDGIRRIANNYFPEQS